jgi:hypothetical protein
MEFLQGPHPPIEPGARKPPAFAAVLGPLVLAIDIVARHRLPALAILMILAPVGLWSLPMRAKRAGRSRASHVRLVLASIGFAVFNVLAGDDVRA